MSQQHNTFKTACKTCGKYIFMRWSDNKQRFYPANNESGKPDFHNCRDQAGAAKGTPYPSAPGQYASTTARAAKLQEMLELHKLASDIAIALYPNDDDKSRRTTMFELMKILRK